MTACEKAGFALSSTSGNVYGASQLHEGSEGRESVEASLATLGCPLALQRWKLPSEVGQASMKLIMAEENKVVLSIAFIILHTVIFYIFMLIILYIL